MERLQVLFQCTHSLGIFILPLARSLLLCHSLLAHWDGIAITFPSVPPHVVSGTCSTRIAVRQGRGGSIAQRPPARHKLRPHYSHASSCLPGTHSRPPSPACACFGQAQIGRWKCCQRSPAPAITRTQAHASTHTYKQARAHASMDGSKTRAGRAVMGDRLPGTRLPHLGQATH